ncbi:hypothetical protein [Sediminibacterium sp.]|uniref:hypothetical protein n=1 Tax=Sediminibacterium sp. TaxID=1917865 RepID=UPI002733F0C4|nr:hypothetical protein [Sediminibacterium sp.]
MKTNFNINEKYKASITKIITTLSKTEKQLSRAIKELENTELDTSTVENYTLK